MGYIEINDINEKYQFETHMVCAEHGFGILMYDSALMYMNPKYLTPSKIITNKSVSIWKYYYESRYDVTKISTIPQIYYQNEMNGIKLKDENLKYINTKYSLVKTKMYNELIDSGKVSMKKYNITSTKISNLGYKKFELLYK